VFAAGTDGRVQVVWSEFLGQGSETGFAFVFHPGRVIGAAKPTTGTIVFLEESRVRAKPRSGLSSRLFHKDTTLDPGMLEEAKVATRSTYLVTDPEEARRIAAQLGIDLSGLPTDGEKLAHLVSQPVIGPRLSDLANVLQDLEAAKVFDLAAEDVSRIEILRPSPEVPGRIVIRTARQIEVINVNHAPVPAEDPIPVLIPRFEEFAPARVVRSV